MKDMQNKDAGFFSRLEQGGGQSAIVTKESAQNFRKELNVIGKAAWDALAPVALVATLPVTLPVLGASALAGEIGRRLNMSPVVAKLSVLMVQTSLLLAACGAAMTPRPSTGETGGNSPTVTEAPIATDEPVIDVTATKTPLPSEVDLISEVVAKSSEMSEEKLLELNKKYQSKTVFGYAQDVQTGMQKVIEVSEEERVGVQLLEGRELSVGGYQLELAVTYVDGRKVVVQNYPNSDQMASLITTEYEGYKLLGMYGEPTGQVDASGRPAYRTPADQDVEDNLLIPSVVTKDGQYWMYSEGDSQFHPIKEDLSALFDETLTDAIGELSGQYGGGSVVDKTGNGEAVIEFDNGWQFKWVDNKLVETYRPLSPEQITANITEWNDKFVGAYLVTPEGEFVKVDKADDTKSTKVESFRYDVDLNVLWQTKFSPELNKDILIPFTLGDARIELKDGVPTGKINFPACAFDGAKCSPETVWFGGEQEETISKAEFMLTTYAWIQEIYQKTLEEQGQAAADAIFDPKSSVRAESGERQRTYMKIGLSSESGPYFTLHDGTVFYIRNSPGDFQWMNSSIRLTDFEGKFVRAVPVPFMSLTASQDGQTGLVVVEDPDGNLQNLLVDAPWMNKFDPDEYERTKLTSVQIPEDVWEEMLKLNGLTSAK